MGVMLNNITWYWYLTWYCLALHGIAWYSHPSPFFYVQSKQTRHKLDWRAEENTEKMVKCELPQPLYTNFVFLLYLILFELINQQQNLIWNPCGLFCGCGFCGVVCGK